MQLIPLLKSSVYMTLFLGAVALPAHAYEALTISNLK